MKKTFFLIALFFVATVSAFAQSNFVEVRGGVTKDGFDYRYIDYIYTFKNDTFVEATYYGGIHLNEVWVGAGKTKKFKDDSEVSIAGYFVAGKEGSEKYTGVGAAVFGSTKVKKANISFQTYGFVPIKGEVKKYLAVDSFEVTTNLGKRVEVGGSTGMFWIGKEADYIVGPVVKFNDKYGSWSVSIRGGTYTEFRVGRTFNF